MSSFTPLAPWVLDLAYAELGTPNFRDPSPLAKRPFDKIANSVGSSQLKSLRPAKTAGGW